MDEDEQEGVLSRWSKRKQAVLEEERAPEPPSPEVLEEQQTAHQELMQANREEAESIDLETINEESDLSIFMKEGVPELLKRQALSALWKSNPIFANIDGLNDYDEDFGAESLIMKTFKSAYKVGSGYAKEVVEAQDDEIEELAEIAKPSKPSTEDEMAASEEYEPEDDLEQDDEVLEEEAVEEINKNHVAEFEDEIGIEQRPVQKVSLRERLALDS